MKRPCSQKEFSDASPELHASPGRWQRSGRMPKSQDDSANSTPGFRQTGDDSGRLRLLMTLGLCVASVSTGALAVSSILATRLPGCGGSMQGATLAPAGWGGCEDAGSSVWGTLTFRSVSVSTALVGLGAYVAAAVLLWMSAPGAAATRWVLRVLMVTSLVFVGAAVAQKFWCPYCMAAHVGVMVAWIGAEWGSRTSAVQPARRTAAKAWTSAVVAGVVLVASGAVVEHVVREARAKAASEQAAQAIVQKQEPSAAERAIPADGKEVREPTAAAQRFTGRYRLGDPLARARIVVISDFQCADCQKLERELMDLAQRPGVSLTMKHFPFCRDCNPNVPRTLHANACWAARAAEAAGMLGGESGFWAMHHWLFARGGGFTEAELRSHVAAQGLAVDQFMAAFTGRETLERVKADVAEAMTLGISRTPMVFVNGVECTGWEHVGTVTRIVSAVLEANVPSDPSATDQPPRAKEKYLAMWRSARVETSANPATRQRGDGLAKIQVVGDYQESDTRELCAILNEILVEGWSAGFAFHHYPADPACNPSIPRKMNDRACELSTLVLACGIAGGDQAYWKAHDHVLRMQNLHVSAGALASETASAAGVSVELVSRSLSGAQTILARQIAETAKVQISELPTLFINGKRMARWKGGVDSRELLRAAIIEACNGAKSLPPP